MVVPLLWVLLAGLALAVGYATGSTAHAWVGYVMLAILVMGVTAGRLGARGLSASRRLSADRIHFGDQVEVEVTVHNQSRLPALWVYAAEALPAGLPMIGVRGRLGLLRGGGRFSFRYALQGTRRGYYQIGPTILRTGDLFGLSLQERVVAPASPLIVFPRILPVRHARLPSHRTAADVRVRQRALEDPTRVVGIRPYQRFDGLRRVHWRATAHTGQLQSKLYELSAQVETVVALSLRRDDYPAAPTETQDAAELAVAAAASLSHHVLEHRHRTGLVVVGRDPQGGDGEPVRIRPGRGRHQLASILSVLGRVSVGPAVPLATVLEREKESFAWGSLVVVIAPQVDQQLLQAILGLRASGYDVSVVLAGRTPRLSGQPSALQAMGVTAAQVRSEGDICGLAL